MAAPPTTVQTPAGVGAVYIIPPTEVGNAFARQYYSILQQSPALVHRFYQNISKLGRPGDDGTMSYTSTMEAIDQKIQSYGSLKADIKFVDAQESYNGGVIVLVTGSMISPDDSRRGFTQTFFLAPQDKGFFVLNDILRYVEDDTKHNERQDGGVAVAPIAPNEEETPPIQENHIVEESNGEVYNPHENGEVPIEGEEEVEEEPVAEVVDEAPNDQQVVVESNVKVDDEPQNHAQAPKSSYASIVMKDTPVTAPSPNIQKSMPKIQEQQTPVAAASVSAPLPSSADMLDNGSNHESEGEGYSIYVKNLPFNVPYPVVEETFKHFGPIKNGGIQIRKNNGFCFGFVEFEGADAARSAIEASPITIAGREAVVEEKRSTFRGSSIRGRFPSGRGSGGGFKGEGGGRGRGGYGGGRGYGRGENNRNDYGNRGGGRGYQNRSDGFRRNDQIGNGVGRVNRGGGSGIGNTRSPRVPAQA